MFARGSILVRVGFTLVEVLIIVVILALTAVISGPSLMRAFAGDPLAAGERQIQQAWQRARLAAAGTGGALEWTVGRMRFIPPNGRAEEFPLDDRIQVAWRGTVPAGPAGRIILDRQGRCIDVRLGLSYRGKSTLVYLSGLSGAARVESTTGGAP